ncbi:hypothetical protein HPB48_007953 [Haemaphysalis longicornis]|uniref:SHSP domain-containing protein n=1 Tax=Haemaphysalis longicornis TaxID=44386 RepID=A0A9J6FLW7_HAELO|nr:hypothetical protein HPB48_007953 [Haemaphysalis longicornis]
MCGCVRLSVIVSSGGILFQGEKGSKKKDAACSLVCLARVARSARRFELGRGRLRNGCRGTETQERYNGYTPSALRVGGHSTEYPIVKKLRPRERIIRDVSLDGMDADPFFARDVSRPSRTKDLEEFKVSFDIGLHFRPDDLSVKTRNGMVFITAKRTDGNVTREFDRKVPLPDGVDPLTVRALLSPTGVLTIRSPRNLSSRYTSSIYERHVPVRMSLY